MIPQTLPAMNREDWLAKRRQGIAVSDLSAILGLSRHKSPIQVFMDKLGLSEEREDNLQMKLGRMLEPTIGTLFVESTGHEIIPGEITQHPTYPFFLGTPDFLLVNRPAGMEAKTTGYANPDDWGAEMSDMVPMQYLIQCLGYIEITGSDEWYLAVLIGGNRDFRIYRIPRNNETQKRLVDAAERFWVDHIEKQVPPPLDATGSSAAYLKRVFPRHAMDEIIPANDEAAQLISAYCRERAALDELEGRCTGIKNQICGHIGNAAGITANGITYTWKAGKDSERTDWKAVATKLNPPSDLIKEHTTITPGARTFRRKESK